MALTQVDQGLLGTYAQYTGFKNRIINGDMRIDQRNAGASGTASSYTVDRWGFAASQASKLTWGQKLNSVTPPAGFVWYLGFQSSSAYSVLSTDYFNVNQPIEGFNVADFGWGTSNAASVTVSFWVRSSLTGTFAATLRNGTPNRSYAFTYTINSANTWEYKTVTIAGDTTGTWASNTSAGIYVTFSLGAGSTDSTSTVGSWQAGNYTHVTGATSVVGTNGATFYITGVQLEKGSTATSFDYRPYGTELALCQRYYYRIWANQGQSNYTKYGLVWEHTSTAAAALINFPVTMRSYPTTLDYGTLSWYNVWDGVGNWTITGIAFDQAAPNSTSIALTTASGMSAGRAGVLQANATTSGYLGFGAEL